MSDQTFSHLHNDTNLQLSHHPLDEVIAELHPLQTSLGGGDGVEYGSIDLLHFLYCIQRGELSHNTLKKQVILKTFSM